VPISAGGGFIGLPDGFSQLPYSMPAGFVQCAPGAEVSAELT